MILTIVKVHFTGKWVEFWFQAKFEYATNSYHLSYKAGYLWEAIEKADIYDDVVSNGLRGKKIKWKQLGPNWEIDSFVKTSLPQSLDNGIDLIC